MANEILNPTEEELNDEAVKQFYQAFYSCYEETKSPYGDFLFNHLKSGKKTLYNKSIKEVKKFDNNFIAILKTAYSSIFKVCKDPRKSLVYDQEVVPMEKAKKVNSDSIRHLASHTQYIKSIKDEEVIPSKILTTYADEYLGVYENRFIKTLINRVNIFLDKRIKLLEENLESIEADEVRYKNNVKLGKTNVDLEINLRISKQEVEETQNAQTLYDEVKELCEKYHGLRGTELYKATALMSDVLPPIMKTNVILHNADFKVAYNLWIFLERSRNIGYDIETDQRNHTDDEVILGDCDILGAYALNNLLYRRGIDGYDFADARKYRKTMRNRAEADNQVNYALTPENITLEHQEASEFLLQKTAEYFNNAYQEAENQGLSFDMSVKKVYREMLNSLNSIYPQMFDVDDENMPNNQEHLDVLKKKQKVLKLIREQKQIDLNKMDREQQKLENQIKTLDAKIKREEERRKAKERKEKERLEKLAAMEKAKALREQKKEEARLRKEKLDAEREQKRKERAEQALKNAELEAQRKKEEALKKAELEAQKKAEEPQEKKPSTTSKKPSTTKKTTATAKKPVVEKPKEEEPKEEAPKPKKTPAKSTAKKKKAKAEEPIILKGTDRQFNSVKLLPKDKRPPRWVKVVNRSTDEEGNENEHKSKAAKRAQQK